MASIRRNSNGEFDYAYETDVYDNDARSYDVSDGSDGVNAEGPVGDGVDVFRSTDYAASYTRVAGTHDFFAEAAVYALPASLRDEFGKGSSTASSTEASFATDPSNPQAQAYDNATQSWGWASPYQNGVQEGASQSSRAGDAFVSGAVGGFSSSGDAASAASPTNRGVFGKASLRERAGNVLDTFTFAVIDSGIDSSAIDPDDQVLSGASRELGPARMVRRASARKAAGKFHRSAAASASEPHRQSVNATIRKYREANITDKATLASRLSAQLQVTKAGAAGAGGTAAGAGGAASAAGTGAAGTAGASLAPILAIIAILLAVLLLLGSCASLLFMVGEDDPVYDFSAAGLSDSELMVANFLAERGLDNLRIAAIMANMRSESGGSVGSEFNFGAIEAGNAVGHGLCQWSYSRYIDLVNFAAARGTSWTDPQTQLEFFWSGPSEYLAWISRGATNSYMITSSASTSPPAGTVVYGSVSTFLNTDDIAAATEAFCYGWERPGIPHMDRRIANAELYYKALNYSATGAKVVEAAYAIAAIGTPYVYGGNNILSGCDCSYFTQYCYKQAGITIPRNSEYQRAFGTCIPIEDALPGDILWMTNHVGIYINETTVIEQTPPYCRITPITHQRWVCAVRITAPE